ncbi:hypothetical protein Kpol_1000p12 [Vanderwaltozyma polyspora DSM 70294]|uniref:Thioesterase domain-containing protein n=1 Tax=Vanderwaltozyma polyspora (strain ATCC 22028 / DSM 70294 / BCRC 21397 / CBS 2163 / NBRC 10782 / NRRL Y-8283 / UCD 57-17) TaxID=436907 RepID=A7TPV2_VANPO|nr:uncharacterized protein Kpol_1000p12 [Vanderwaltozyma polyspora DSM 70294]EDO15700.1 hypothetical protein Kpol_1000p12 [Vanderwaltozyma polyspora DSM 70294]
MFKGVGLLRFVRHASTKKFVVERSQTKLSNQKWVPWAIFGGSFATGWFFTQHMTFTDLIAYWRYDKLPRSSEEVQKYEADLTNRLHRLPIVQQLSNSGYSEVFPIGRDSKVGDNKLIDKTLATPGGIAIPPKFYYNPETKETIGIYHLGMKLTGYPFIVHGGMLATVMEDQMRESVKFIKNKEGEKIKDLTVSYKLPTLANQFVVVRTTKVEEFGKNVKLTVEVMDQTGNRKLVEGRGTFST